MRLAWRVINDSNDVIYEDTLLGVEVVDAFNRHARHATVSLMDRTGNLNIQFPELTPLRLQYNLDPTQVNYLLQENGDRLLQENGDGILLDDQGWVTRFGGFVVNPQRDDNHLVLDVLSHDYWLRKREVFASYEASYVSEILEDLIDDLTPLTWEPSIVLLPDDAQITRRWHGENLDVVLRELASISGEYEYGANNNQEFFFRPRNLTTAPTGFQVGTYVESEFDDDFTQEANRVRIFYGEGDDRGSIVVQDVGRQLDLQNRIGSAGPVVVEVDAHYPEIVTEAAAEEKAYSILNQKEQLLKGTITTWGRLTTFPGMSAGVVDPEVGVSGSFRVAEIRYKWPSYPPTRVLVAEDRDDITDILVNLSDDVVRVDVRDADPDAVRTDVVDINIPVQVSYEVLVERLDLAPDKFLFGKWGGHTGRIAVGGGELGWPYEAPVTVLDTTTE